MSVIITLLVISFIVFFHELGHFLFAKLNKIKVIEFSIGMGPRLISRQIGETRYSIKALPLGGSCSMEGMLEETENTDEEVSERSFTKKGKLARSMVIAAGPVFNFILALALAFIIVSIKGYNMPVITEVVEENQVSDEKLEEGDVILSINGKSVHNSKAVVFSMLSYNGEKPIDIKVRRTVKRIVFDDIIKSESYDILTVTVMPKKNPDLNIYSIGIRLSNEKVKGNFIKNLSYAYQEMLFHIETTVSSLKMLVTGKANINELVGPIGLSSVVDNAIKEEVKTDESSSAADNKNSTGESNESQRVKTRISSDAAFNIMNIAALISANLGVINLLPIPAFDGGRLLLIGIEAIRRKKLKPKTEERIVVAGFLVLIGLSLFIFMNDIVRLVGRYFGA